MSGKTPKVTRGSSLKFKEQLEEDEKKHDDKKQDEKKHEEKKHDEKKHDEKKQNEKKHSVKKHDEKKHDEKKHDEKEQDDPVSTTELKADASTNELKADADDDTETNDINTEDDLADKEQEKADADELMTKRRSLQATLMHAPESLKNIAVWKHSGVSKTLEAGPQVSDDINQQYYDKVVEKVKKDQFKEKTVLLEMAGIWSMYEEGQRQLIKQSKILEKTRSVVEKLELDAVTDDRVKLAIRYAAKHRTECLRMEKEVQELEDELTQRDGVVAALEERVKFYEKEFDRRRDQLNQLTKCRDNLSDMEIKNSQKQNQIKALLLKEVEVAAEVEAEFALLNAKFEREKNALSTDTRSEIVNLQRVVEKLQKTKVALSEDFNMLYYQNKELLKESKVHEAQYKNAIFKLRHSETQRRGLEKDTKIAIEKVRVLETARASQIETLQQYKTTYDKMIKDISDAKLENRKITADYDSAKEKIRMKDAEIRKLEEKTQTQGSLVENLNMQTQYLSKGMGKLNTQLNKGQEHINSLTCELQRLDFRLNSAKTTINDKNQTIRECEMSKKQLDDCNAALVADLGAKEGVINKFINQSTRLCVILKEAQLTLKTCEDNNCHLKIYAQSLEKKTDGLEEDLRFEADVSNKCAKKNAQLAVEVNIIQDILHAKSEEASKKAMEIRSMHADSQKQLNQIETIQTKYDRLDHAMAVKTLECLNLQNELDKCHDKVELTQRELNTANTKINELMRCLGRQMLENQEASRMKDFEKATADMRTVELKLLEERMEVAEEKLKNGNSILLNRHNDVRILIIEVKDLRRKIAIQNKDINLFHKLKEEHANVVRALIQTKNRLEALEKMKPTLIHPNTHLKYINVSAYELHQKVNHLTARLIRKTTEVTEKETIIMKKDQLFLQLKAMLTRHPKLQTCSMELWEAKKSLQQKEKENKALKAELETFKYNTAIASRKMADQQRDLDERKKSLLQEKRKLQRASESRGSTITLKVPSQGTPQSTPGLTTSPLKTPYITPQMSRATVALPAIRLNKPTRPGKDN